MEAFADEQPSLVLLVHLDSLLYVYGDSRSAMRRRERRQALARVRATAGTRNCSLAGAWRIWSQRFLPSWR
jgi:hypothetical protein